MIRRVCNDCDEEIDPEGGCGCACVAPVAEPKRLWRVYRIDRVTREVSERAIGWAESEGVALADAQRLAASCDGEHSYLVRNPDNLETHVAHPPTTRVSISFFREVATVRNPTGAGLATGRRRGCLQLIDGGADRKKGDDS